MKIAIGADHRGVKMKSALSELLAARGIDVEDAGSYGDESVDYPDFAHPVASLVADGSADLGVLVCSTGIGMSISANKYPSVRAALCHTVPAAISARRHNDANVLVLPGDAVSQEDAGSILEGWLDASFEDDGRHGRRVEKISMYEGMASEISAVRAVDPQVFEAIRSEADNELRTINLIASENYASRAVRQAQGSVMTNKYAEGYPGKRWYNGCQYVDDAETLAIDRAKELFGAEHANVQSHSGSGANMAVYFAMLEPGDAILAMSLAHGGHLTHGHAINFSGKLFDFSSYGVSESDECIDYEDVSRIAAETRPKLIVVGASAYPRLLDFARFREIADEAGAYLMVDMAHIAGLVAAGVHPNPVPYADFVTSTTHKTLRGPRAGMVLCREAHAKAIDREVFPGLQGGPLMHTIAAKAVCFREALAPDFKQYGAQIVSNAAAMADVFSGAGLRLISGGTENHLMLIDVTSVGLNGKDAANLLESVGVVVNKNAIPFDKESPFVTSGIRIGTPAVTTRGMKDADVRTLAGMIVRALQSGGDADVLAAIKTEVTTLAMEFPVP